MLAAGTRLGPFEVGPLLGVGGMGEVYRARDERLGRDVATSPVWSPAGDVIAYIETRPPNGTIVHTIDAHGKPVGAGFPPIRTEFANGFLSWSRDGRRLAGASLGGSLRGSLWIADPTAAVTYQKILDLPSATHLRGIAWSPDGTELLVGVVGRSSDIVLGERSVR